MPSVNNSWVIERHDQEDGSITYEVWDHHPPTYGRILTINTYYDDPEAKKFAEHIVEVHNNWIIQKR